MLEGTGDGSATGTAIYCSGSESYSNGTIGACVLVKEGTELASCTGEDVGGLSADTVGPSVLSGEAFGSTVIGDADGSRVGLELGTGVSGAAEGPFVGARDGDKVGEGVIGYEIGLAVGRSDGTFDGLAVGAGEGRGVGAGDGLAVGAGEGRGVGAGVGRGVGRGLGAGVGLQKRGNECREQKQKDQRSSIVQQ